MVTGRQARQAEHISAEQAARLVKSGDWVDYGVTLSQPDVFDKALAGRKSELSDVKIRDRKSTRLNSSHSQQSRMPSSA